MCSSFELSNHIVVAAKAIMLLLPWFPIGRYYYRSRASFQTGRDGPGAECPSAVHMSSLDMKPKK